MLGILNYLNYLLKRSKSNNFPENGYMVIQKLKGNVISQYEIQPGREGEILEINQFNGDVFMFGKNE